METTSKTETAEPSPGKTVEAVDLAPLLGNWVNSNPATKWIKRFTLAKRDGAAVLHAFGAQEPLDWGEVELTAYMGDSAMVGFHAVYDLGSMEAILAANTNKGLVVIVAFYKFKDQSGRANFISREFYFREQ